jgi:hypothetical protein
MRSSSKWSLSLSLSGLPTKALYVHLLSSIIATCPAHIILDLITQTIFGDEYTSLSSLLCDLPHFPVTSSFFGRNIFLSTLFLNTISLGSSLNVRDQVWHLYKITYKSTVLYILIFVFLDRRMEDKIFCTKRLQRNYITWKYREYWRIPATRVSLQQGFTHTHRRILDGSKGRKLHSPPTPILFLPQYIFGFGVQVGQIKVIGVSANILRIGSSQSSPLPNLTVSPIKVPNTHSLFYPVSPPLPSFISQFTPVHSRSQ